MSLASAKSRTDARNRIRREAFGLAAIVVAAMAAPPFLQSASANGDTRTLTFVHTHTSESATITFRRNGRFEQQALDQLNWLLRDWRVNKPAKMDPLLFDILWEVYRESGSSQPINIISAYRSPETNGALRRRSKAVSEHSQHMLGKAMDIRLPDVDTARLRAIAMRMQYGGVGYYASSAFVHIDTGNVRAWPRMSQDQLAKLFPDGKTLHLPSNGKPLPGYEQAKAEILARNAALAAQASVGGGGPSLGSLLAGLFGGGKTQPPQAEPAPAEGKTILAYADPDSIELVQPRIPLPPQRPQEPASAGPADPGVRLVPAPPRALSSARRPETPLGFDENAARQALFDPRAFFIDTGFSTDGMEDLSATHFTGPAVKPLPFVRQVEADL